MNHLKLIYITCTFLVCWLINTDLAWARLPAYREFSINNGLPHTDAYCTVQDNKGFLWFATLDGLCRYDGVDMVVYRNDHTDPYSISNNRITALEFDKYRNGLWIGTQGGGLNFMDLVSGRFYKIDIHGEAQPVLEIITIKVVEQQNLWIGTQYGLFTAKIDNQKPYAPKFQKVFLGENRIIESIHQDKNKGLWVGTLEELFYKPPGKGSFKALHAEKLRGVYAVISYDETHVLAGTISGLFIIDLENFSLRKLNDLKVASLLVDKPNSIWVGTLSNGLFNCGVDGALKQNYSFDQTLEPHKYKVKNIYKDRSASIFVSTLGGGIKLINKNNYTFKSYQQQFTEEDRVKLKRPLCFYADNNSVLYIGTRLNGLAIYDRLNEQIRFYQVGENKINSPFGNEVTAIFKDNDQKLWIGKAEGVYMLEKKDINNNSIRSNSFKFLSNPFQPFRINKIVQDKKERIWVVTSRGLLCYNKTGQLIYTTKNLPAQYASLNTDYLNDIVLNEEKNSHALTIWLATKSGISRLVLNNSDFSFIRLQKFTAGSGDKQLYSNWISLLHVDQNHVIWAGTIGGGLSKVIPGKHGNVAFETITTKDGLLTNDIETLLEDSEGNFWIGSIGLTKYNPKSKLFSYYDAHDGLQSNAFKVWAAFKRNDGEMIFGGINGFNMFYPQNVKKEIQVFTPQLTNLIINNITVKTGSKIEGEVILPQTLPYTSEITLNHKIRNFGLEFASIHSHDFQKIVYKYRLLGYDKHWTYTNSKKRFVNYTGLPSGDYTFQLYASGGEGVWNSQPLTLNIHIIPPFWRSKYGYLLYAFVIVGGLFLQRRYTLIRLDIKHKIQLDKTRQEQEIKSYEDKVEFFTNLSHELRTPLTLITTPIEQLVKYPELPAIVSNKLLTVHKNAERLRNLIDQILDIRKLELGKIKLNKESINITQFLNNLFVQFQDLAAKKDIILSLNVKLNQEVLIDIFKMEQVLINLLSNAVKFMPVKGEITLSCFKEDDQVIMNVFNTGSKLSTEEQTKVFEPFYQVESVNRQGTGLGLTISKYLVELHDGTITVHSALDDQSGLPFTCFTIKIPALNVEINGGHSNADQESDIKTANSETSTKGQKSALVIVDDNTELTELLKEEFSLDYKVYTAENGREGLKLIRKTKPVLVITDVMMPEVDGIVLCKALKNDVATNDIPVIMLTAKSTDQNRLAGLEAMADDYVSKPFNLKELHLKVKNTVRQRANLRVKLNNDVVLNPTTLTFMGRDERVLKEVIEIIESNIDNPDFSVEQLCKIAAISRPVLYRKIKEQTGMSIQIFILDIRLKRAAQLLKTKGLSVSEVMYKTGFSSPSYFNKAFKNKYHTSPIHYNESIKV